MKDIVSCFTAPSISLNHHRSAWHTSWGFWEVSFLLHSLALKTWILRSEKGDIHYPGFSRSQGSVFPRTCSTAHGFHSTDQGPPNLKPPPVSTVGIRDPKKNAVGDLDPKPGRFKQYIHAISRWLEKVHKFLHKWWLNGDVTLIESQNSSGFNKSKLSHGFFSLLAGKHGHFRKLHLSQLGEWFFTLYWCGQGSQATWTNGSSPISSAKKLLGTHFHNLLTKQSTTTTLRNGFVWWIFWICEWLEDIPQMVVSLMVLNPMVERIRTKITKKQTQVCINPKISANPGNSKLELPPDWYGSAMLTSVTFALSLLFG